MEAEVRWEAFEHALEVGGALRFAGKDREIAESFLLAVVILSDKAYSGGQVAIDYEQLLGVPVQTSPGEGFGGWLSMAVPTLLELRTIAEEATANLEPWKVDAWLSVRQPGAERETEREVAARLDMPKTTIQNAVAFVDRCLAGRLRVRGYVVRCTGG